MGKRKGSIIIFFMFIFSLSLALPSSTALADSKKLEVIIQKANIHLEPSETSPLVESLDRGTILTLASSSRVKIYWFYVYFISPATGKTRAGYVRAEQVRPLFPALKVIHISSEGEISSPREMDTTSGNLFDLEWGISKNQIIRSEGRPFSQESRDGLEILRYRKEIMNKKWQVEYVVGEQGLITTRYQLLENYFNKSLYLEDYNKLRLHLTEKAGDPRSDKVLWQNPVYEKQKEDPGSALANGHIVFASEWVFRDTSVKLKLAGEQNIIVLNAEVQDVKSKTF